VWCGGGGNNKAESPRLHAGRLGVSLGFA
jgi:hypothetical protein